MPAASFRWPVWHLWLHPQANSWVPRPNEHSDRHLEQHTHGNTHSSFYPAAHRYGDGSCDRFTVVTVGW